MTSLAAVQRAQRHVVNAITTPRPHLSVAPASALGHCPHFRAKKQFSSGVEEGLSNQVKVSMRKSHGFWTFRITLEMLAALG